MTHELHPRHLHQLATPYFGSSFQGIIYVQQFNATFVTTNIKKNADQIQYHLIDEKNGQPTNNAALVLYETIAKLHPLTTGLRHTISCRENVHFDGKTLSLNYELGYLRIQAQLADASSKLIILNGQKLVEEHKLAKGQECIETFLGKKTFFCIRTSTATYRYNPHTLTPITSAEVVTGAPTSEPDEPVILDLV